MKKIGLLSDTHAYWDDRYSKHFKECDEIWHVGDIGSMEVIEKLQSFKATFRGVYGNIDGQDIRRILPETNIFEIENAKVVMKHIGGYPGKYAPLVKNILIKEKPQLFISGHSHILKVGFDKELGILHINPGAAGKYGFHQVRTLVRFNISDGSFSKLEVIELND